MTLHASRPGWWLDELAHAGDEHLDDAYVAGYERKAGIDPTADLELLRALGLDGTSTLVDLGAGTGTLALPAARICRRVVAVDVSAPMLAAVRSAAERLGVANLECVQAGFLTYAHRGDPADFVYSRNALHHLPDFWKAIALQRVIRMLRPAGVFRLHDLIFSFEADEAEAVIEAWLARAQPTPETGWTKAELETHLRAEHSTYNWLLEPMLLHTGFEIREASYRMGVYAAYTCVRRASS